MKPYLSSCLLVLFSLSLTAQSYTLQDTLKGSITPERGWWDLNYYHLSVAVDPATRTIEGENLIRFTALEPGQTLQIDLQQPMELRRAVYQGKELEFSHQGNAHYVTLPDTLAAGTTAEFTVYFGGTPRIALNPPWDGGLTWKADVNGKPFVANANQGIGASVWWPNKDHPADEVDSMAISVTVPAGLMDVSNGRLRNVETLSDGRKTYHWYVDNPINNYGVNLSVGDYVSWSETYAGEDGPLDVSYYVLRQNEAAARKQFTQTPMMLEAFEHWFGPYPFYEDGFKLVEVPYLGMEHQSAVTYGNEFANGYRGRDLSGTGEGLKFDFIIIHESGHEWFANNITNADEADMWIHEGFTAYSENLYLDYHFGKEASSRYVRGTRSSIQNQAPIQSRDRGVGSSGSGDMYYKGANVLHTLRQLVNDDEQWRAVLRGLNREFRHQTITAAQLVDYLAEELPVEGLEMHLFWMQYAETILIPTLEYSFQGDRLGYRWINVLPGFEMPVDVSLGDDGATKRLLATQQWQSLELDGAEPSLRIDPDFYVGSMDSTVE